MEASEGFSSYELFAVGAMVAILVVAIANQIAMYFFWPPSRPIYLLLCVIGFGLTPALGLTVQPPMETLGYELSAFIAGATLALAYLPPVSEKFNRAAVDSKGSE
jgi:hypothetical protein